MRLKWVFVFFMACCPINAFAFGLADFFFETSIMKMRIDYEEQDVTHHPLLIRAKSAYMLTANAAVELQVGSTVKADETDNGDISAYIAALNVRYGAPKHAAAASAYVSTGISVTRIAVERGNFEDFNDVNNLSIGFGIEERLSSLRNAKITLEITRFFAEEDDDPELGSIALGFRTDF